LLRMLHPNRNRRPENPEIVNARDIKLQNSGPCYCIVTARTLFHGKRRHRFCDAASTLENGMALDVNTEIAPYDAPEKDLYEIGEMPPLGYVPKSMYAWAIRKERHGEPDTAMQVEVV